MYLINLFQNTTRYKKNIIANNNENSKIEIKSFKNTQGQLEYIRKNINDETAILYRNNISAIDVMNMLNNNNISYYIKDSNMSFFNHFIIKDIIDILNFANDRRDFDSFQRIYYKFNAYFKKDFIKQISYMDPNKDIFERLYKCDGINNFYEDKIATLDFVLDRISSYNIERAIKNIYLSTGYKEYLEEKARREQIQFIQYVKIIDTLINISKGLKTQKELEDKFLYLRKTQKESSKNISKLTLSTVHGSKGLEYNNVIVIDLIDEIFPNTNSKKDIALLEEERRLFYVAMTRAKNKLHLIYPQSIQKEKTKRSQFIDEIIK